MNDNVVFEEVTPAPTPEMAAAGGAGGGCAALGLVCVGGGVACIGAGAGCGGDCYGAVCGIGC